MLVDINQNYDLSNLSTLRVSAQAQYFAKPSSLEELKEIFVFIKEKNLDFHVLGAGSNILLSSRSIPGVLISTNDLKTIKQINDTEFEVGAGVRMPRLCAFVSKESLTGAEWMEGIPGSVGGGVVMNAGAHGTEMKDNIKTVQVFNTETLELEDWDCEDFGFVYRNSKVDPKKHIVFSAVFAYEKGDKDEIRKRIVENNYARTTRQPVKSFTCGCTFKNPEPSTSAGLLIQELGLKGLREGDFMVSNLHGNFIENLGEGNSEEFCKLMKQVQDEVLKRRGIKLKPEVQRMGEFSDEENELWS